MPPLVFIAQVEKLGLIGQLDNWVRRTAMAHCKAIGLAGRDFFLDLNLSPLQTVDDALIEELEQVLKDTGYPPHKLNLEITESSRMDFSPDNMEGLHRLQAAGIVLSLDDFGTGYSNLNNLVNLPARVLKTEKAFIDHLEQDNYQQYLMKMLVDLAHTLGMRVIAEGVETAGQRELLAGYGVDYMQGYLFSRPLDADTLAASVGCYSPEDG